jgi:hypothetical protein
MGETLNYGLQEGHVLRAPRVPVSLDSIVFVLPDTSVFVDMCRRIGLNRASAVLGKGCKRSIPVSLLR